MPEGDQGHREIGFIYIPGLRRTSSTHNLRPFQQGVGLHGRIKVGQVFGSRFKGNVQILVVNGIIMVL